MRTDSEMLWIPMILGHQAVGGLIAIIFGRWANISTFATGAKAGALIGFLTTAAHGLINLGVTNVSTTTGVIADMVVGSVITTIVGGVIGWFLGRDA